MIRRKTAALVAASDGGGAILGRGGGSRTSSSRSSMHSRASRAAPSLVQSVAVSRPPDLDVVVVGGGGHVGLPVSLTFAAAGLCVGIYDTNVATLERIARGEMPF